MDSIIAVNPVSIQPKINKEKPECIYCLDDKGFMLVNKKCNCKYHYHNGCELKSINSRHLTCPICRKIFCNSPNTLEDPVVIHISEETTVINQNETPSRFCKQDYIMLISSTFIIIIFSILPIIYYSNP